MISFSSMLKTFAELHERVVCVVSGVVLSDDVVLKNSTNKRLQEIESAIKKYQEAVYKAEDAARALKALLQ